MEFATLNGRIYNPKGHIIEDLSFILTIDREDESMVNPFKFGNHDDIIKIDLPRINLMNDQVKIVCFTFDDQHLNKTALSKKDQVKITNYIRNTRNNPKVASIAHAIYNTDAEGLEIAFNDVLNNVKKDSKQSN